MICGPRLPIRLLGAAGLVHDQSWKVEIMAQYSFSNRSRDRQPGNEFIGNVVLKIAEFDHDRNAASGVTPDGEVLTIRLADKREFADLYVNRSRFTTQDARERIAAKQTGNRPDTGALAQKMEPGEGAIQFQSVKRVGDELVARWMESVSTTAQDSYVRAQVRVQVPRSNEETAGRTERRRADIVLEDTASAATMDVLDEFASNRITGHDGKRLDGEIRSAVLVAVQAADDPSETPSTLVWSPWDKDAKRLKPGGEALFDKPLNAHNWETMVPLAAQVGVPFERIRFDESRVNATDRTENARALYDATRAGNIKVAVAQGFTVEAMPRLRDAIVQSEREAHESGGRVATMADRGFFGADVGLRSRPGQEGFGDQVSVKQILANEFLHPRSSESYAPRTVEALGARVVAAAEARGQRLTLEAPMQQRPAQEPAPQQRPTAQLAPSI
jgi:hypothetical protein